MALIVDPIPLAADPGDRLAMLFTQWYPQLVGLSTRLTRNRADAEEIAQEAFIRLANSPVLARPEAEIGAWLRRVCLNLGANRLRDDQRARDRVDRAGRLWLVGAAAPDPADQVTRQETRDTVRQALGGLPDRQRDCLILRHAGYSYAEIAATLNLAVGSVGALIARGERAFRAAYPVDASDATDHQGE